MTLTADPFTAPATNDDGVKRDRFGRYLLPDPVTGKEKAWTRATTVARTLADEYHLTLWKMRQVAKGMALRPDLIAGAAAADPEADKKTLNDIAEKAMERAGSSAGSTLGTALHKLSVKLDRGALVRDEVPPPVIADLDEYGATLKRHRLTVDRRYIERIVILPDLGIAGQFDRLYGQPPGQTKAKPRAVGDLKTAKSDDAGALSSFSMFEIAIQLSIYANAPLIWNPVTESYEPMPADLCKDRGLVVHLPIGRAHGQLYGVNLIDGWRWAQLAVEVRAARSAGKGACWLVDPEPADLALQRVQIAPDRAELARLWEQLHPKGMWTEEVNAAALARMTELETVSA